MTSPSDAELVRRCLADDADAWKLLTERYGDVVFSIARRQGLSAEAASDVVQDVFLSLLKSLRRVRHAERLVGWIVRSARREAWRSLRRDRSRRGLESRVARSESSPRAAPERLEEIEARVAVRQAYGALGERCRRLLDALFATEQGTPYAVVARELGVAVGSLGAMRRRCLEQLRDELVALGFPDDARA